MASSIMHLQKAWGKYDKDKDGFLSIEEAVQLLN
ncbi:EF hand, partial [Haematococcus lacustris]